MDVKDKLAKLLRLAQNNPNPNEAAVAFEQAQRLATRAGLDLDSIDTAEDWRPPELQVIEPELLFAGRRVATWRQSLAVLVCEAYGVGVFKSPRGIEMYGQRRDLDAVSYMFAAASEAVENLARTYLKAQRRGRSFGNAFRVGAATQIGQAIRDEARQALNEVTNAAQIITEEKGLVRRNALVQYKRAVSDAVAEYRETHLDLTKKRTGRGVRSDGYAAGREAGNNVRLSQPRKAIGE